MFKIKQYLLGELSRLINNLLLPQICFLDDLYMSRKLFYKNNHFYFIA